MCCLRVLSHVFVCRLLFVCSLLFVSVFWGVVCLVAVWLMFGRCFRFCVFVGFLPCVFVLCWLLVRYFVRWSVRLLVVCLSSACCVSSVRLLFVLLLVAW